MSPKNIKRLTTILITIGITLFILGIFWIQHYSCETNYQDNIKLCQQWFDPETEKQAHNECIQKFLIEKQRCQAR